MKSLSDIARELGVSIAAVSYVYNGKWRENRISPELAERIAKKLEQEHSRPNLLGQQLRTGRTHTIGVMLPDLIRSYSLELFAGIERVLAEASYFTLLCNSHLGANETDYFDELRARNVDGVILSPQRVEHDHLRRAREEGTRIVLIDNYAPLEGVDFVVSDNRWGAAAAVRHCLEQGRRRIAYFGSDKDIAVLNDRWTGYQDALRDAGLPVDPKLVFRRADPVFSARLTELLEQTPRPDALLVDSLHYFSDGFRFLAERGVRIPDDLLVVGFDWPPPETMAERGAAGLAPIPCLVQPAREMGRMAAERLLARIDGLDGEPLREFLRPSLGWETTARL